MYVVYLTLLLYYPWYTVPQQYTTQGRFFHFSLLLLLLLFYGYPGYYRVVCTFYISCIVDFIAKNASSRIYITTYILYMYIHICTCRIAGRWDTCMGCASFLWQKEKERKGSWEYSRKSLVKEWRSYLQYLNLDRVCFTAHRACVHVHMYLRGYWIQRYLQCFTCYQLHVYPVLHTYTCTVYMWYIHTYMTC